MTCGTFTWASYSYCILGCCSLSVQYIWNHTSVEQSTHSNHTAATPWSCGCLEMGQTFFRWVFIHVYTGYLKQFFMICLCSFRVWDMKEFDDASDVVHRALPYILENWHSKTAQQSHSRRTMSAQTALKPHILGMISMHFPYNLHAASVWICLGLPPVSPTM